MNPKTTDGNSLWRESYGNNVYDRLLSNIEVDAVIIGAGITGLTTAYLLKKAGKTVAVIEKDTIGGGTTGRTTGKVTSQHSLIYAELQKTIGKESTKLYGEIAEGALQLIDTIISNEDISCDWQRDTNYVFTADAKKVDKFKKEVEVAASLGLPASFENELQLPFKIVGAVAFANQAKFNSEKYLLGLARKVHGDGSYVYEHSKATLIQDGDPCIVKTSDGKVTARHIVIATNVPTLPLAARATYCALEYPTESYIVAGHYNNPLNGMYISPDKNHYSILPIEVDGEKRLLIGGGGHMSGLRGSKDWRFSRLRQYAQSHFNMTEFTHEWSDRDYVAYDKVPLIGKVYPWSKNMYVGTAFKKWGLTGGTSAAMILSDFILGNESKYTKVFTPQRLKPIVSIPKAVIEQIKQLTSP